MPATPHPTIASLIRRLGRARPAAPIIAEEGADEALEETDIEATLVSIDEALEEVKTTLAALARDVAELRAAAHATAPARRSGFYVGDGRVLTVTNRGDRLYVDADDIMITPGILCFGGWEDETAAFLDRTLKPGMVWADVGANIGYFTVIGHRLVAPSGGRTFAFEPAPRSFSLLQQNVALNWLWTGVTTERLAAHEKDDRVAFYINRRFTVNAGLGPGWMPGPTGLVDDQSRCIAQARRLDGYFKQHGVIPDFLKIDVEGAELHVLRGIEGLLAEQPELSFLIEWSPSQYQALGYEPSLILDWLRGHRMTLSVVDKTVEPIATEALAAREHAMLYCGRARV